MVASNAISQIFKNNNFQVQCLTLFVTHYPSVMDTVNELEGKAGNYHMAFFLHDEGKF